MSKIEIVYEKTGETVHGIPTIGKVILDNGKALPLIEVGETIEEWNDKAQKQNAVFLTSNGVDPTPENIDTLCRLVRRSIVIMSPPDVDRVLEVLRGSRHED